MKQLVDGDRAGDEVQPLELAEGHEAPKCAVAIRHASVERVVAGVRGIPVVARVRWGATPRREEALGEEVRQTLRVCKHGGGGEVREERST